MKQYKSHRVVSAARIVDFTREPNSCVVSLKLDDDSAATLPNTRFGNYTPTEGMFIRYDDGYESFCPIAQFEAGYARVDDEGVLLAEPPKLGTVPSLDERIAARPGPKVTPQDVAEAFVACSYHHFPGTRVTVACATMRNGFSVVGSSSCVDDANFDETIGRQLALKDCQRQADAFLGYALRAQLAKQDNAPCTSTGATS